MAYGVLACSKPAVPESPTSPDATFDLSAEQLGMSDASGVVRALRELAGADAEPVTVRFMSGERSITFEVMLAEHEDAYDFKPFVKGAHGEWFYPRPPAKPPGDIEPTWVRVTAGEIVVGGSKFSNAEYADWLELYAGAIGSIGERSALVVETDSGVTSARLFDVLSMLADHRLDRFLIEKAKQERVANDPPAPGSAWTDDSDLD